MRKKLQAAMEYLTTYGWAILLIAIVFALLFNMGVFNPNTFAPKAQPGSCQINRPFGPGTQQDTSMSGTCNEMPKYVAQFNGQNSYIDTGGSFMPLGGSARSVFAWVYFTGTSVRSTIYGYGDYFGGAGEGAALEILPSGNNGDLYFESDVYNAGGPSFSEGQWVWIGYTYLNGNILFYVNGKELSGGYLGSVLNTQLPSTDQANIGKDSAGINYPFNGMMSNVQIYNTSLSSNDILSLYYEGIGGAPIVMHNLVGWWPLNGNTNDYSGNRKTGVAANIIYVSNWDGGYSAP